MSDVFGPSFSTPKPVRASTPLSSPSDESGTINDSSCSVLAPQNISLLSDDSSSCSDEASGCVMSQGQSNSCSEEAVDSLPPLPKGYTHGSLWFGLKILGDNLDKTVRPRDMRSNHQSQSLHYFNLCAVRDRIDFSVFSGESSTIDLSKLDMSVFLPSTADMDALRSNFTILISRILCQYFPSLFEYSSSVAQHIKHKYSQEMSSKSHVVSLLHLVAILC